MNVLFYCLVSILCQHLIFDDSFSCVNGQEMKVSTVSINEVAERNHKRSLLMCEVEHSGWLLATRCEGMAWIFITDL